MPQSVKFATKYRVYYEDTDSGGVVYYANYLKFFERCRTDFLRSKGINQKELANKESTLFVVRNCNIDYIRPAQLDDLITVTMDVKEVRAASIILNQTIYANQVILATLEVSIVSVDANDFKPKKIGENIRNLFLR